MEPFQQLILAILLYSVATTLFIVHLLWELHKQIDKKEGIKWQLIKIKESPGMTFLYMVYLDLLPI